MPSLALQQDCSRRFGMTAQATLDTAQRLYETYKATTYPRTDCGYLPTEQFSAAADVLAAVRRCHWDRGVAALVANADLKLRSRAWNDAKITAHHAIIPTAAPVRVGDMGEDDRRVYNLVVRRYLAQFYPNYDYDQTRMEARFGQEVFVATGTTLVATGWKAVFVEAAEGDEDGNGATPLPRLSQGDALTCLSAVVDAKQTKPPPRYTEGTLLQAMKSVGAKIDDPALRKILKETSGIGTEATRASIIETLVQRAYIERQGKKKSLISTAKARQLIDVLPAPVKDPATTALWEQALEEIAEGRAPMGPFLERQASWVRQIVDRARQQGITRP
ncbi:MAG: DNA topoisomerase [Nevskia sp.]|nr:DNA topoisomerase [Nevskia sp.]